MQSPIHGANNVTGATTDSAPLFRFPTDCWFLTGPTASGKSRLALRIAETTGAEIVAMDSMTLYKGLDIGSAKPTLADRRRVPHHLVDVLEPWESASLDWYLRQARRIAEEIARRGKPVLFVGGTPLYLKALFRGIFQGPPADPAFRATLEERADREGSDVLRRALATIDPKAAEKLDRNDRRRLIRALEVHHHTGRPISEWQDQFSKPASPRPRAVCLAPPKITCLRTQRERIAAMIRDGWIDEARRLKSLDRPLSREAVQAVGYKEIFAFLDAELTREQMIERIEIRTRRLYKHQLTWFRHLEELTMWPISDEEQDDKLASRLIEFYRQAAN